MGHTTGAKRPALKGSIMRHLPTFADLTLGAHKADDNNGFVLAIMGAAWFGATMGILGAAGLCVALIGIMVSIVGMGMLFGPRPIDATLFYAAVALPYSFACNVVRVDAKRAPLRLGTVESSLAKALAHYGRVWNDDAKRATAQARIEKVWGQRAVARARWLGEWPS